MLRNLLLLITILFFHNSYSQSDTIPIIDSTFQIENVQVIGIRPTKNEPITLTTLKVDSLNYVPASDPFFLINRYTPNILSQSDNGSTHGYSYIKIRGLDQTRINFTLNGIPLNEMEDQGIYFSNMPNFINNIDQIQIQRGIGTSKYGTTSFAGSVNMETKSPLSKELKFGLGGGSYGTIFGNFGYSSGLLRNKFAFSSNISYLESNGFRYHSGTDGLNYFGQFAYFGKKNIIKVYEFTGVSRNGMSWLAPSDSILNFDIRKNLNSEEERDKFNQNLGVINWINYGIENLKFNSSVYINNINGEYTSYLDEDEHLDTLGRFGLNSYQAGLMSNIVYEKNSISINSGINYNYYQRRHTLSDNLYPDDLFYTNRGYKQDFITFIKFNKSFKDLNLFVDLQYRYVNFNYDKKMSHGWHFINPKIGVKYNKKDWNIYTSIAMTGREVTRTDLLNGYDNVDVINKTTLTSFEDTFNVNFKPERCYDLEVGGFFTKKGFTFSGNVYVMYFNNERISTGDINYIGLLLKSPTEKSIRTGLEMDMNYKYKGFSVATNLSVSKNKIYKWSDKNGNNYLNVSPFGSPRFTMNNTIEYSHKYFYVNLNGMFVSKMYLDNTQNEKFATPSYYLLNSNVGVKFKSLCISMIVNNIINTKYYLPGGLYMNRPAFYPGALRNYLINVQVTL